MSKKYLILLLLIFLDAKCITRPLQPGEPIGDNISRAIGILEQGIRDIEGESAQWRAVLEQVSKDLPQEVSSLIRNELQQFADRTIAVAGVEAACRIDMLNKRATTFLQRLIAKLKNQSPPLMPPTFCQVVPGNISLSDDPNTWQTITLYGYDFDNKDIAGNLVGVDLLGESGATALLSETYIGRTSHYQITLNLSSTAKTLYQSKIAKLRVVWNGTPLDAQGQVTVLPWKPKEKKEIVPPTTTVYMPPKTGGDSDFDTGSSEPMTIDTRAELSITSTSIEGRVYLKAREPRPDYTTAEGWSAWSHFYDVPNGWKIISVRPNANAQQAANITSHGQFDYPRPASEVIKAFHVWGDRNGDEAGSYTQVKADWRALEVIIQEIAPSWAQ